MFVSDVVVSDGVLDGVDESAPAMSRRLFFRRAGLGAATTFVITDGLVAYRAYDQGVMSEGRGPAFDAWTSWRSGNGPESLVGAAILAANGHNTQPWQFALGQNRIDLFADLNRSTGANDPLLRELHISLGCALENLMLASSAQGYDAAIELDQNSTSGHVATVTLRKGTVRIPPLYEAIGKRRSNRSEYRSLPVAASVLSTMSELVDSSVASARLVWLLDNADRKRFGDLLVDATRAYVADEEQSKASFLWWRSDWDSIQKHKDGLTIDGVGLRPLVRTLGKILPSSSRQAADKTFIDRTRIQATSAAAFGVVMVDDPSSLSARINGGRLLQRLHLWASDQGLGFQHMNQITERIDRDGQLGRPSPVEQPLAELVGPGSLAAFRIGTPTVKSIRSPRRSVTEVLR